MRNLLTHILNLPIETIADIGIKNTAYCIVSYSGNRWIVEDLYGITVPTCKRRK